MVEKYLMKTFKYSKNYILHMINFLDNKNLIIGLVIAFIVYMILKGSGKRDKEFEKEYNEILYSDKYKVKGQFD